MTRKKNNSALKEIKRMIAEDGDYLRPMVRAVIEEFFGSRDGRGRRGGKGRAHRRTTELPQRVLHPQLGEPSGQAR